MKQTQTRMCAALLLLVSFFFSGTSLFAADLVTRNFKILPTDQTAINRETMKKDQNGKTAALLKIFTSLNPDETYFDNGVMGIVGRDNKPGQIWLYIPARSQKIQITNTRHNRIELFFPEEIISGKTYSFDLSVEGKEVTLAASVRQAPIWVDGDSLGLSPQNVYLSYGDHAVKAEKGSMLYEGNISVSKQGPSRFELEMEDENLKYSDVTVTVPANAEIWFQGKHVGSGEWRTRLLGGDYSVELRKPNYEPEVERFTATAGQPTMVKCKALTPYRGFLNIHVIPTTGAKILDGDTVVAEHSLAKRLDVGKYRYTFRKKGYISQTLDFTVNRNADTNDTVILKRVQYILPNSIYAGAGVSYAGGLGAGAHVGFTIRNFNLEGGYTMGFTKSDDLYWFSDSDNIFDSTCTYSTDLGYIKAGYRFSLVQRIGLTPQVGWLGQRLRGGTRGNGAMCHNLSIGLRAIFNPIPNLGIFVTPEYAVPVSVNQLYDDIAARSNITKGGFAVSAGISFSFKL